MNFQHRLMLPLIDKMSYLHRVTSHGLYYG